MEVFCWQGEYDLLLKKYRLECSEMCRVSKGGIE